MKKLYTIFLFCFIIANIAQAQKKIELNNQTPGWLSSLLTYPQQQELEEIKVTGYINQVDIDFLKDLTSLSLTSIDLYDANIVKYNNYPANTLKDNFFKREPNADFINKFVLPKNIEKVETNAFYFAYVDTLVIGYENIDGAIQTSTVTINNLILLEGVKNIRTPITYRDWGANKINLVSKIPNSVEIIHGAGDSKVFSPSYMTKGINIPSNIQRFGSETGSPLAYDDNVDRVLINEKTVTIPETCEILNFSSWYTIKADSLILPQKLKYIEAIFDVKYIVCESETPPTIKTYRAGTIICPKGCLDAYKRAFNSSSITIEERSIPIQALTLNKESLVLNVGERYMLLTDIEPLDATNTKLSWSTTNKNVVTVDESGLLTAVSPGRSMVIAATTDGSNISAVCDVTVDEFNGIEDINSDNNIKISTLGTTLIIQGAITGKNLSIYSVAGIMVANTTAIDSEIKIQLPVRGMYIVRIDGISHKIII